MAFEVTYTAQIQVDQLDAAEKAHLNRLFASPQPEGTRVQTATSEPRFVSKLGQKRVLWRRGKGGIFEVLSVVDQSYAA